MKKTLPLSRIPNDIKYLVAESLGRLEDTKVLLSALDPVAFPDGELDSLIVAVQDALLAVQAIRPRKRTVLVVFGSVVHAAV